MAHGHFAPVETGAYRLDYASQLRMELEQERKEQDYEARVASWVASRMIGRQFDSLDQLTEAAITLATERHGTLTGQQVYHLRRGVVALWAGILESRFLVERNVRAPITIEPHTVRFEAA